jgi:hypothetical protein
MNPNQNPNPINRFIEWLFQRGAGAANTIRRFFERLSFSLGGMRGRQCSAGHWMPPDWTDCKYCEADATASEKSVDKTRVQHPGNAESLGGEDSRRVTGVLVTFSWRHQGQLFPVFEGTTLIGSGNVAANRRPCEVQINSDRTLSREHAMIRCLGENYEIFDQKSENGTYMNGRPVPVHGMPLEDHSSIKTGGTLWTFQMIKAPTGSRILAPPSGDEDFKLRDVAMDDSEPDDRTVLEPYRPERHSEASERAGVTRFPETDAERAGTDRKSVV